MEATTPPSTIKQKNLKVALICAAIIVAIMMWTSGSLDRALVNVGLNYNDCYSNAFGATFCGEQATEYRKQFGQ